MMPRAPRRQRRANVKAKPTIWNPFLPYSLAIFDFDGTLADSLAWTRGVMNQVARRFRFKQLTDDEFAMLRGWETAAIIRYLGVPMWKLPFIAVHVRRLMGRDAHTIPLFEGAGSLLRTLHDGGVILAIVSSNSEDNIRRILGPENVALISYFECGASIFGKSAKLWRVFKHSGVAHDAIICIGDESRDIEAAASQRLASGAVTWGYAAAERLRAHGPTLVFDSMEEIASALLHSAKRSSSL
jgi:phosphoglycolate phosphatase